MKRMSLKELCFYFNMYNYIDGEDRCEYYKSEYFNLNIGKTDFEYLDESDVIGLRPYLQCLVLSIYEYLARYNNVPLADWFNKYSEAHCLMEENDYYIALRDGYMQLHPGELSTEVPDRIFMNMLEKSIEPFKSRGIARNVLNDAV